MHQHTPTATTSASTAGTTMSTNTTPTTITTVRTSMTTDHPCTKTTAHKWKLALLYKNGCPHTKATTHVWRWPLTNKSEATICEYPPLLFTPSPRPHSPSLYSTPPSLTSPLHHTPPSLSITPLPISTTYSLSPLLPPPSTTSLSLDHSLALPLSLNIECSKISLSSLI